MGRTLHYSITKDNGQKFTIRELEKMYEVSKFYNSAELLEEINTTYKTELKDLWTCENFWFGIGNFYPNWDIDIFKGMTGIVAWELIDKRIKSLQKEMSYIEAVLYLLKKNFIVTFNDTPYKFNGFTKTQGNEFNSLLVYKALVSISEKIPTATIELSDEGKFLFCPLKIKKGKVLPVVSKVVEDIEYYSKKLILSKSKFSILDELKNANFQTDFFERDILGGGSDNFVKYIDDSLRDLKEVEAVLLKELGNNEKLFFYNLENRNPKDWFKPMLFVRPVDVMKFLDYKMDAGTLMDGFDGEGFGLSNKDSEAESYRAIANVFKMLGVTEKNVKILGEDK